MEPIASRSCTSREDRLICRGPMWLLRLMVVAGAVIAGSAGASAQGGFFERKPDDSDQATSAPRPRDYKSRNFLLHTDLSPQEADDLLDRLETMLAMISKYWGRRNEKPIECYVVRDLDNWPDGALHPMGRAKIAQQSGVTVTRAVVRGNRLNAKSVVYAIADHGTPQHEAVHAYCGQTFGRTGPAWYAEGMAEMGNYWREGDSSVNCPQPIINFIRSSPPKSLDEIVNSESGSGDSWRTYAWRWALCHLLANNPNYFDRFRPLGLGLLTGQNVSFNSVYGSMAREISFEYRFFLKHIEPGYRVDLCSWDWKGKYRTPRIGNGSSVRVVANAGWQSTRLLVKQNAEYEFTATGSWQLDKDGRELTADGSADGAGRLMAIVFDDYELSKPIELGTSGTFAAPAAGKLFLRCRDGWGSLADNRGRITVRIKSRDR